MKILHTADLHLARDNDKRLDILRWLVEKTNELKAECLIIAGDLFDTDTDATVLRPKVKEIFESTGAEIILIPGNHDKNSYSFNYDYGKNVSQLIEKPFCLLTIGKINFCAIPYQGKKFSECIKELNQDIDILIVHGMVFDETFVYARYDEDIHSMPIYPVDLENSARYVALGHIHSRVFQKDYKKTKAIYPGSPIALNTKCQKERMIMEIDLDESSLVIKPLIVDIAPYYETFEFFVYPKLEDDFFLRLEKELERLNKKIMPQIVIKGFIEMDEKGFNQHLKEIENKFTNEFFDFRITAEGIVPWGEILKNPLIGKFVKRTEGLPDELRMKILEISLPVFSELL